MPAAPGRLDTVDARVGDELSEVLTHLKQGFAYTKQAVADVPTDSLIKKRKMFGQEFDVVESSLAMTGDLHEHLGQLIAYARINGIKPPWSRN